MYGYTAGKRRHGEEIGNLLYEVYGLSMRGSSLYEECWL